MLYIYVRVFTSNRMDLFSYSTKHLVHVCNHKCDKTIGNEAQNVQTDASLSKCLFYHLSNITTSPLATMEEDWSSKFTLFRVHMAVIYTLLNCKIYKLLNQVTINSVFLIPMPFNYNTSLQFYVEKCQEKLM